MGRERGGQAARRARLYEKLRGVKKNNKSPGDYIKADFLGEITRIIKLRQPEPETHIRQVAHEQGGYENYSNEVKKEAINYFLDNVEQVNAGGALADESDASNAEQLKEAIKEIDTFRQKEGGEAIFRKIALQVGIELAYEQTPKPPSILERLRAFINRNTADGEDQFTITRDDGDLQKPSVEDTAGQTQQTEESPQEASPVNPPSPSEKSQDPGDLSPREGENKESRLGGWFKAVRDFVRDPLQRGVTLQNWREGLENRAKLALAVVKETAKNITQAIRGGKPSQEEVTDAKAQQGKVAEAEQGVSESKQEVSEAKQGEAVKTGQKKSASEKVKPQTRNKDKPPLDPEKRNDRVQLIVRALQTRQVFSNTENKGTGRFWVFPLSKGGGAKLVTLDKNNTFSFPVGGGKNETISLAGVDAPIREKFYSSLLDRTTRGKGSAIDITDVETFKSEVKQFSDNPQAYFNQSTEQSSLASHLYGKDEQPQSQADHVKEEKQAFEKTFNGEPVKSKAYILEQQGDSPQQGDEEEADQDQEKSQTIKP